MDNRKTGEHLDENRVAPMLEPFVGLINGPDAWTEEMHLHTIQKEIMNKKQKNRVLDYVKRVGKVSDEDIKKEADRIEKELEQMKELKDIKDSE